MVRIVSPNELTARNGTDWYVARAPDDDDVIEVNMTALLDEGETLSAVATELWRIGDIDGLEIGDPTLVPSGATGLQDAPVIVGSNAQQRVRSVLDANTWYRLWFYIGAAPNYRGTHVLIKCVEN